MRIAVGADHAGYPLNLRIIDEIKRAGHEAIDFGARDGSQPDDYPDYARVVGEAIQRKEADFGVLICGSGVGVCVAANKMIGIRAGLCHDTFSARQGREDDDLNVLCLGPRVLGAELAADILRAFLAASFSGAERHRRRLAKVAQIESSNLMST